MIKHTQPVNMKEIEREAERRYPYNTDLSKNNLYQAHKNAIDDKRQIFIDGYTLAQQGEKDRACGFVEWIIEQNYSWCVSYWVKTMDDKKYTTSELYDLYTQSLGEGVEDGESEDGILNEICDSARAHVDCDGCFSGSEFIDYLHENFIIKSKPTPPNQKQGV